MAHSPYLLYCGFAFQVLAVGLWVGALLYFLFIGSPVLFRECQNNMLASQIHSVMLRRYHTWEVIAGLASLSGAGFLYVGGVHGFLLFTDVTIALLMFLICVFYAGYLLPQIEDMRIKLRDEQMFSQEPDAATMQRFLQMHALHSRMMVINSLLGGALLLVVIGLAVTCAIPQETVSLDSSLFSSPPGLF